MEGRREIRFIGIRTVWAVKPKGRKDPSYVTYRLALPVNVARSWALQLGKVPERVLVTFDGWRLTIEPYVEEKREGVLAAASSREKKVSSGG
jgi:hypothetical protein